MSSIFEFELSVRDKSGCPFGSKIVEVSANFNAGNWSIQRVKPQKNEKKGKGMTRWLAVIDWLHENNKRD